MKGKDGSGSEDWAGDDVSPEFNNSSVFPVVVYLMGTFMPGMPFALYRSDVKFL